MNYELLGKSGLKVSQLCLGTMGFGKDWGWGADLETSKQIFETFVAAGGNFIDTANLYTDGTSESFIGDFMQQNRDFLVLATKYSLRDSAANTNPNASGNSRKNMMRSVELSLKRLKTDYIDLFYLHAWDSLTPIDEVMRGLDDLVTQGKVNYIGISDTPAWVVAKGNTLAELMGWNQFVALQVEYSLLQRTPEQDLLPMAAHFGLSLVPWAPLAGGALTGKYLRGEPGRLKQGSTRLGDRSIAITEKLIEIAQTLNTEPAAVALNWVMQQAKACIPIVGATSPAQVLQNLKSTQIKLEPTHISQLNELSKIELGFPHDFLQQEGVKAVLYSGFYDKIIK